MTVLWERFQDRTIPFPRLDILRVGLEGSCFQPAMLGCLMGWGGNGAGWVRV